MRKVYADEAEYLSSLKDECRKCGLPDCDDYMPPYWNNYMIKTEQGLCRPRHQVHKKCKPAAMAEQAYECQKIDSDCNDCGYFQRRRSHKGVCGGWAEGGVSS